MKDEAKEILDDLLFTTTLPNVSVKLNKEKLNQLKDCITNLQEELKSANESVTWWSNRFNALQKENKRLKERCEYLEKSNNRREDEIMSLRDECVDGETYKSRNEKAIRTLETLKGSARWERHLYEVDYLLNILQGEDKDE